MSFIADLHIHSRFSRATSKQLTPAHLAAWARCKGIDLLGTGDFTHPQWREELRTPLVEDADSGLYRLRQGMAETPDFLEGDGGLLHDAEPRFILQTEISSIYKRHGKVRKVHNLVFVPTLEDADKLSRRLEGIGNLASDGRPILGLDSRDLLEICLETCPGSVLVPAHVWTPWFALFGSKSGFDRLEDCFGDLSSHIFALETGLSSDPAMNRLVSSLDGYALISNSDAHSGANLGREANLFAGDPSYDGLFAALRRAARREAQDGQDCRFLGTLEFYPEEGKYHLDGHRACQVVMTPREALACNNICPVCGKPLTIGVLHRVWELADREEPARLAHEPDVHPLIPLPELVGEVLGAGAGSRKVQQRYAQLLRTLGSDMDILCHLPLSDIAACWGPLAEAVGRMRRGEVHREGGYDGEYGVVRVFSPEEAAELHGRRARRATTGRKTAPASASALPLLEGGSRTEPQASTAPGDDIRRFRQDLDAQAASPADETRTPDFSDEQLVALTAGPEPVLVLAGPGAGKTRVLVGRLRHLLRQGIAPQDVLAITFTRRAASEMRERLAADETGPETSLPACDTLHALAWAHLQQQDPHAVLLSEEAARDLFRQASPALDSATARRHFDAYSLWREQEQHGRHLPPDAGELPLLGAPSQPWHTAACAYAAAKRTHTPRLYDYADLLDDFLLAAKRGDVPARQQGSPSYAPCCRKTAAVSSASGILTRPFTDFAARTDRMRKASAPSGPRCASSILPAATGRDRASWMPLAASCANADSAALCTPPVLWPAACIFLPLPRRRRKPAGSPDMWDACSAGRRSHCTRKARPQDMCWTAAFPPETSLSSCASGPRSRPSGRPSRPRASPAAHPPRKVAPATTFAGPSSLPPPGARTWRDASRLHGTKPPTV